MATFRRNPLVEKQLRATVEHRAGIRAAAGVAAGKVRALAAQAQAPWMRRKGATDTIAVDQDGERVRIVNTDHAGHLQEFGSVNNPPYAPLRRGVRAAGLRLDEQSKT